MKKIKTLFLLTVFVLLGINVPLFAQADLIPESKQNMPNNWGKRSGEQDLMPDYNSNNIPVQLLNQYEAAKQSGNEQEKSKIGNMIQDILLKDNHPIHISGTHEPAEEIKPPFTPDWYESDVQIMNTDVAHTNGYRQIDLKQGEDGWLYLAINERNLTGGLQGRIRVWKSSNGGANWIPLSGIQSNSTYYGSIALLVEKRSASIDDSTRIIVYFTGSSQSNFDNASLYMFSVTRINSNWYWYAAGSPSAGNKFEYPSACSDGMYFSTATSMHCVVREVSNNGNTDAGIKHFLTTNWGQTHSSSTINSLATDLYPSVAYGEKNGSDSIYIAVERIVNSNESEVRVLATSEIPSSNYFAYYITSAVNIKYEKPCLTIVQQHYSVPKKMIITCTKDNISRYHYSNNGGNTWNVDLALTTTGLRDFSWCSSDTNTAEGGYITAAVVDQDGDSITVRRGIPGSLGTALYKRNSVQSTGLLAPVCITYRENNTLYSAFAYAGFGPNSAYFNSEILITGVEPISATMPDNFGLSQNYPNPFNPSTKINFSLPKSGNVEIKVYDVMGKEVAVLVNEFKSAGTYAVDFDAGNFSSGIYFYSIKSGDFTAIKKMVLVK